MSGGRSNTNSNRDDSIWRDTLAALAAHPLSAMQLAATLGVEEACASNRLRKLYQGGYIARTDNYRSTHRYTLTTAGHTLRTSEARISMPARMPTADDVQQSSLDYTALHAALGMGQAPAKLTGRVVKRLDRRARA